MEFIIDMIGKSFKDVFEQAGLEGVIGFIVVGTLSAWVISGFKMPWDFGKKK